MAGGRSYLLSITWFSVALQTHYTLTEGLQGLQAYPLIGFVVGRLIITVSKCVLSQSHCSPFRCALAISMAWPQHLSACATWSSRRWSWNRSRYRSRSTVGRAGGPPLKCRRRRRRRKSAKPRMNDSTARQTVSCGRCWRSWSRWNFASASRFNWFCCGPLARLANKIRELGQLI